MKIENPFSSLPRSNGGSETKLLKHDQATESSAGSTTSGEEVFSVDLGLSKGLKPLELSKFEKNVET